MLTTKTLQENLAHCIGRKTVYVENGIIYHFGTPILHVTDNAVIMTRAYDYSASTSRVRNAALRLLSGMENIPTTQELRKAELNGEILNCGSYKIFFEWWS